MPYVERNVNGQVIGWTAHPSEENSEFLEEGHPDIVAFQDGASAVTSVTKAQAKIVLHRHGLLGAVKAAVAQDPEAQIWFDDAATWERENPYILQFSQALGITSEQLDAMFQEASEVASS